MGAKELGIKTAENHANAVHDNWSEVALKYLKKYIKKHDRFMAEDVRNASKKYVPEPPSGRAWGGIMVKAHNLGLIRHVGYSNVKNEKAHRTPASVCLLVSVS